MKLIYTSDEKIKEYLIQKGYKQLIDRSISSKTPLFCFLNNGETIKEQTIKDNIYYSSLFYL